MRPEETLGDAAVRLASERHAVAFQVVDAPRGALGDDLHGVRVGEKVRLLERVGCMLLPAVLGIHRGEGRVDAAGREGGGGVGLGPLAQGQHIDPGLGELDQPSLSRQIAALEQDLGAELLHRARGGTTLTTAGESLLPLARRMLADAESVRRELAELAGLQRGRVRLGATPSLCISFVAEVLSAFHAAHPTIELHPSEQGSRRLLDELARGELDLALINTSEATAVERFTVTPLLVEELVLISSAGRPPVTTGNTISLEAIAELPQVVFSATYELRSTTDAAFHAAGLTPTVVLEGAEMDAVLRFVERELGVAIVPAMVLIDRPGLRSVRLDGPTLTRSITLVRPADVASTAAVAVMQRTIAATATAFAARVGSTMRLAEPRA
ncbi:MAG: LysR family transcriptional regulator [Cryobacterium sp.]|nr:LysR family transcriptional regulator [Cryobacterium sp.]